MRLVLGLGLLSLEAVFLAQAVPTIPPAAARHSVLELQLEPEVSRARSLQPGEEHVFGARLMRGQVFAALLQPYGPAVTIELTDPSGRRLLRVDHPALTGGAEPVFAIASTSGVYRLRVKGAGRASAAGDRASYTLRAESPRFASARDRLRAKAFAELSAGEDLRREATGTSRRDSLAAYHRSLRIWQRLGETEGQVITWARIGRAHEDLEDFPEAADAYRHALGLARHPSEQAELLVSVGLVENRLGDPSRALGRFQEASQLAREARSALYEARALTYAGQVFSGLGEIVAAEVSYRQALEAWNRAGLLAGRLRTLQSLACHYLLIGDPARALDRLQEAREIDPHPAGTLRLLGMSFLLGGRDGFALHLLGGALEQARIEGDAVLQAVILGDLGSVALRLGDLDQSAAAFDECLRISLEKKLVSGEAYARAGRGRVLGLRGRLDAAKAELDRADAMFRSLKEPAAMALVLAGKAALERERGHLQRALQLSSEAVDLIEAQRREIESPRARAALLSYWSDPFEIQIDVLWRLARRAPGRGFEARAFEVSEKIRARTLWEGLAAAGTSRRPEIAELQRQRREVGLQLRNLEWEKLHLREEPGEAGRSRNLQIHAEIRDLLSRESALREKIRHSDPRSALAGLQLLTLPQVQSLLDEKTALLVYKLGEDRSFVWWIERGALAMRALPGRSEIEAVARQAQTELARPAPRRPAERLNALLARLSELVLAPVAKELERVRRVAIVPDGALQTLPFSALPQPRASGHLAGEPLVASHVLVSLPSPSILAALRRREEERSPPPDKLIALFTDPVFEPDDPRIVRPHSRELVLPRLLRLDQTRTEAGKILRLVPPGMGRELTGFAAVPEAVREPDLRRYRYLHFGTHGFVDMRHPELSGVVLSQYTPDGRRRDDGNLPFYEVYDLDLPVDLVSLSTCRSADGPQIRLEGPITMTRSFLYAGASRVLGTLWDVNDTSAAELTVTFYEGVLRDGKRPAEALRDAQDAMRRKGWAVRNWATFVLQGDWR